MTDMPQVDDRDVIRAISSAAFAAVHELSAQFPAIGINFEAHLCEVIKQMLNGEPAIQGCVWGAELHRLVAEPMQTNNEEVAND